MSEGVKQLHPNDHLRMRLEAARAQRREIEDRRAKRSEDQELAAQVAAEERAVLDQKALEEAEAEIGEKKILAVETTQGLIIVKRPRAMLYKRFRDVGEVKTQDLEKLVRPCIVHPDLSRFDQMCDEEPAILDRCGDRVVTLAGFRAKEAAGK